MSTENIQKLIIGGLGIILLVIVLLFMLPALTRGEGNITIQTAPRDAQVTFDGKTYQSLVKLESVAARRYKVEVTKKGYKTRVDEVVVEKGKSSEITLRLYSSEMSPTEVRANLDDINEIKSDLEKIAGYLPYAADGFKIDLAATARKPTVQITLYARINRPSQYDKFKKDIKIFSKAALDWIRSKGVNPENLDIKWEPVDPEKF